MVIGPSRGAAVLRRYLAAARPRLRRVSPRAWLALAVVGVLVVAVPVGISRWTADAAVPFRVEDAMLDVRSGPGTDATTQLDTSMYVPETATEADPAPAVLVPHGFGGTKESVRQVAGDLAGRGYVVVTWTARGFGASGGNIHLMSPDHEVADARQLVDWLAKRPEVSRDGTDPRVGVVGSSYGGALGLMLAGTDQRVDAIVPQATWNDLARSLFPEATGGSPKHGVFKQAWTSQLFSAGLVAPEQASAPGCGRFAAEICRLYQAAATKGRASTDLVAMLREHSPMSVTDRITAPTLLVQGTADTLFSLAEADVTARQIGKSDTPVRVAWFSGGHDGGLGSVNDEERVRDLTLGWLDHYLWGRGPEPGSSFTFSRINGTDPEDGRVRAVGYESPTYPGLGGSKEPHTVLLAGRPTEILNPAGGAPAAVSSVPGLAELLRGAGVASSQLATAREVPGQSAAYESEPLAEPRSVAGTPTISLRAASPSGTAVLFVKIYDVAPDGTATLPAGQVAPVRLTGLPSRLADAEPLQVRLPAISHLFSAEHSIRVTVSASDRAYAAPRQPATYTVDLAEPAVRLPAVYTRADLGNANLWLWLPLATACAIGVLALVAWLIGRRRTRRVWADVAELADVRDVTHAGPTERASSEPVPNQLGSNQPASTDVRDAPLAVEGLRKEYADGHVAVDGVDFVVRRGEVVGLLGPNGAGKTTTLRMLLGLIRPTAGEVTVFGHRVLPGTPVLSRVGALVEGPGFAPHLTGRANLELYWQSTGRPPEDARLGEVLEIADLGAAVDRKVGKYSHGMKQRLAIAQAMLGTPELLILDEPTDGLDPPQIAAMRHVLENYAHGGSVPRAVVVSSHLLGEVEQTCTHVVVMHKGRCVAAGAVGDVIGTSAHVMLEVTDRARAEAVLADVGAVRSVARQNGSLVVDLGGLERSELVRKLVDAGIGVRSVSTARRLEDAFLALVGGQR